jgi:hypothetical protein
VIYRLFFNLNREILKFRATVFINILLSQEFFIGGKQLRETIMEKFSSPHLQEDLNYLEEFYFLK